MYEDVLEDRQEANTVDESADVEVITEPTLEEDQPDPKDPFPVTGKPIEPNHTGRWRSPNPSGIEITD